MKEDHMPYHELLLVHVDDSMVSSHDPGKTIATIGVVHKLKDGKYGAPESYLGTGIEKFTLPNSQQAWNMQSDRYDKTAIEMVKVIN